MERWRKADGRVRMLFRRTRLARELDEEMRFHLEHAARSLHEGSLPEDAAAEEAARRFGNTLRMRERSMEAWGFGRAESVAQDLRFGTRMLLRRPVLALVIITLLALGIGLNAAMFSIVEAVILRPLPYSDAKQLTIVWQSSAEHRATGEWFDSYREFEEWQRRSRSFASLAALSWASGPTIAEWRGKRQKVLAIPVSSNFFSMLGVRAQYGRVFEPRDAGSCAVVVSYPYWRDQLGAEKQAPGQNLMLDQQACMVVGVMPERFSFYPRETSLWTVITPQSEFVQQPWKSPTAVLGRLRRGVSRAAAEQELAAIESSIAEERPRSMVLPPSVPVVLDLQREFTWLAGRNLRQGLTMLSAAVALVLLIVCVNVVSLLLGRSAERQREMAIRASIGCGRVRMIRQLLTEALVLSMCGAAAGVGIAEAMLRIFRATNPVELPPGNAVEMRWPVLLFVAALSVLCTLACGVVPAWRASRMDLMNALKSDARGGGVSTQRVAKMMVILQVALSLVLLTGATLLATSLARLSNESLGFRVDHLLTAELSSPTRPSADADAQEQQSEAILQRVLTLPGVRSAALASSVLPRGSDALAVAGKTFDARSAAPDVANQIVSTEYLRTTELPLLAGRNFAASDRKDTQAVAMINARLAEEYFPAGDALGRQIKLGSSEDHSSPQLTVVGVVGNVKTTNVFREMGHVTPPVVYRPMAQAPGQATTLVMRTAAEPMGISEQVRKAVTSMDREAVVSDMKAMQTILQEQSAQPRFRTMLLGGFAGMALVLSALGIYGLLTQQVMRRTLEIGIRMALGANKRDIARRIVRQALTLAGGGIVLGTLGSFAAARVVSGLLYETSASDPWLLGAATAVFVVVALGASVAPAWRASSVDPIVSMRAE
jgi:putative ABC transport system permease protein